MAKMFYTTEEAKKVLNCTDTDLKQYSREGRLREFRDGSRLMYKADQIDNMADGPTLAIETDTDTVLDALADEMLNSCKPRRVNLDNLSHQNSLPNPDATPLHKPYEKERTESPLWDIVEKAINELVENKDLKATTYPYYVVGYLVRKLEGNGRKEGK